MASKFETKYSDRLLTLWLPCGVAFLALLPIMIFRDFTPDNELRYLSIADEALRNGRWWSFTFCGEAYADKPPLYLWLTMLARVLFGNGCMWMMSMVSFVPGVVTAWILDKWMSPKLSVRERRAGTFMLLTTGLFLGMMVTVRMDMLMTMWIMLALDQAARKPDTPKRGWMMGFYSFMGLFTKGPVGLLMPLVCCVAWYGIKGEWRELLRLWGWRAWSVIIAGCMVWFTAVWIEGGTDYLYNLTFHQTVDRAVDAFHHKRPWWYYFKELPLVLLPWTVLMPWGAMPAWREGGERVRFAIIGAGATFVMLSLFSSKLAVYLLPTIPLLVYATAMGLMMRYKGGLSKWISGLSAGLFAAILVASVWAIPWFNHTQCYGDVSREAVDLAKREGLKRYYVMEVKRSEAMDVYLGERPKEVTAQQVSEGTLPRGVLITPDAKGHGYVVKTITSSTPDFPSASHESE